MMSGTGERFDDLPAARAPVIRAVKAAARERAEREPRERLQRALDRMPELEAIKRRNGVPPEQARASSTDADATVMQMADGGFRPAFNGQLASRCDTQVIVGVEVTSSGSDMAQLVPMVEQVEQRSRADPLEVAGRWRLPLVMTNSMLRRARPGFMRPCPNPVPRRARQATTSSRTSTSPSPRTARRRPSVASALGRASRHSADAMVNARRRTHRL
jgi:hypothetical protein